MANNSQSAAALTQDAADAMHDYEVPSSGISETSWETEDDILRDADEETSRGPLQSPRKALQNAFASFSSVASKQQRRLARAPQRFDALRSRLRKGGERISDKVSGDKTMSTIISVIGSLIFAGLGALSMYCVVLGSQFFSYPGALCRGEDDYHPSLQTWLIVRGLTTLLSTCLIIVAVVTRAQSSDESKVSRQSGRLASSGLGFVELFNFIWVFAGTVWIAQFNAGPQDTILACPKLVRDFVTYYIVVFWSLVGLLITLACGLSCCCNNTRLDGENDLPHGRLGNDESRDYTTAMGGDIDMVEFAGSDSLMEI